MANPTWKYTISVDSKDVATALKNKIMKIDSGITVKIEKTKDFERTGQYSVKTSIQSAGGLNKNYDTMADIDRKVKSIYDAERKSQRDRALPNESVIPNLSETYRRYFGDLSSEDRVGRKISTPSGKQSLNESQMKTWLHLHKTFKAQYPSRTLVMSEGVIKLDGHLVESADKFLTRDLASMVTVLRNALRSIKK